MDDFQRSCVRSYVDHNKIKSLREELSRIANLDRQSEILAMLADPTRLKILLSLAKGGELCVCDLADVLDREVSAISHQLRRLKDRGLVKNRREGLTIYYRLAPSNECLEALKMADAVLQKKPEREFV